MTVEPLNVLAALNVNCPSLILARPCGPEITPPRINEPLSTTPIVRVPLSVSATLNICGTTIMLSAMSPPRIIPLPAMVNAAEGLLKVIPPNRVPAGKSFTGVLRTLPPKKRESAALGAVPPQLAGVLQKLSAPSPVHVRLAAWLVGAAKSAKAIEIARRDIQILFMGDNARRSARLLAFDC